LQFSYRTADCQGHIEIGRGEADSREQMFVKLKGSGKFPLEVKEETASFNEVKLRFIARRVSPQERLDFTRQLGNLLASGIPLEKALGILSRLTLSSEMVTVVRQMRRSLQEGLSFTAALEKYPNYFPELYINMVRAGEAGGLLPQVLNRLAQYLQEEIELKRFIVSSLFYPVIVMGASIGAIFFFVGVVIPKFQSIFRDMGSELPLVTRIVMFFGNTLWNFWWVLACLVVLAVLGLIRERATTSGRLRLDRLKLNLPLLGPVLLRIAMARMALSLSLLSGSGVPILEGLSISGKVVGNEVLARALGKVEEQVRQGSALAGSMSALQIFPPLAVEMIGVGEESGTLVEMMDQVAKTYDGEVKHSLSMFLAAFEPLLILLMVGIIAILAMAVLLPILNMNNQLNTMA
jgi:type II secretory pathway component PulF